MSPENEASPQHYTTIHTTKSFSHAHWDLQPSKPCCGAEERQLLCSWYKWWHLSCGSTEGDRNQETVWEKEKKKKWWNFRDGLLAKQFVINLSVKTDGKPQGSGSAKTLYRRIFRNTVFCYYAGKPLLHTIPVTVVVFDIQNRSLKAWFCTTEVKRSFSNGFQLLLIEEKLSGLNADRKKALYHKILDFKSLPLHEWSFWLLRGDIRGRNKE